LYYFLSDGLTSINSNGSSWNAIWYLVSVTSDGTTLKMYINGVQQTKTVSLGALNFMKFTKKDLSFCIITGFTAGIILWLVAGYTHRAGILGHSYAWLIIIVPILWTIGVNLGFFLGKYIGFFNQFGKFAAIGFTNWAVDSGVLALLLSLFGVTAGLLYTVAKAISFIVANLHSFAWNKCWVFDSGASGQTGVQFGKFFGVSIVSAIINITVASIVVNFVHPIMNFNSETWAIFGSVAGSAIALIVSFVGFRMAVFNKK